MTSIYARGRRLWARIKPDRWRSVPTPFDVGEEAEALRFADAEQQRRRASRMADPTVGAYATPWLEQRRLAHHDWTTDRSRLRRVLSFLGHLRLTEVRRWHLAELLLQLRAESAPRTVHNVYWTVAAMFRDAFLENLIDETPCRLDRRQLGPAGDADPEWRAGALFERDEAQALISDVRIPLDRRMFYALGLLAGIRPGEAAGLRWLHHDRRALPLERLTIAVAYNTRGHRMKATKTRAFRSIPVHPTLSAMLEEWRAGGWSAMVGRAPGADDLIVPLPPYDAARRRARHGEPWRGTDYIGRRWRDVDLAMLGWRYRAIYATRATFITHALDDGADPILLRERITHARPRRPFDGYNRGLQWQLTCAEIQKLRLDRSPAAAQLSFDLGAAG